MPPLICTAHLGRWGGDPLCKHCRTVTGKPRRRERTRLRWHTHGVVYLAALTAFLGFELGLVFANLTGYPFHG